MNQEQLVLNNLKRALVAEEKLGFTNSGVLGGFHNFLTGILARLEQLFPERDWGVLKRFAQTYPDLSPQQRREAYRNLFFFLQEIAEEARHSGLQSVGNPVDNSENSSGDTPAATPVRTKMDQYSNSYGDNKEELLAGARPATIRTGREEIQYLKGVGPERARQLQKLGIRSTEDLLLYYPRRYEDRRQRLIADLKDGDFATVTGKVVAGQVSAGKTKVVKLSLEQNGRLIYAVWFNQTFILKQYPVGTMVSASGKVRWQQKVPEIMVNDIEKAGRKDAGAEIIGIYSETGGLSSKVIRTLIQKIINKTDDYFRELLPVEDRKDWMERNAAHRSIHFPASNQDLHKARERLVWEEILFLQLAVARLRNRVQRQDSPLLHGSRELIRRFLAALPFELTGAQKRVIQEIFHDIAQSQGMARLVQGDVGSGKTAVAMAALLQTVGSGYQGAMMAPTEILALQHFESLTKAFTPLGITVVCLLGSQSRTEREEILAMIADGRAQVIVGTHALIQESVVFHALGLAVTDEQHRFGVRQRSSLHQKGENPHVLVLTATPIPRTLALTLYGDLQLSVLDEMPAGRKPIITRKVTERTRPNMEKFLEEQMALGRQVYVVCPLVEESETLDLISATERAADLAKKFPHRKVALLHGRMKGQEKEEIMQEFAQGKINILAATTVVEVGVNVPNASVMVVEGAERFGLAQLHQLRGRVGRGSEQSYCLLMSDGKGSRRLDVLCQTQDGFKIAEEDLRLRGSGELLGIRQHGLTELRLADLSRDGQLVEKAYQMAQKVLQHPEKYRALIEEVERVFAPEKVGVH